MKTKTFSKKLTLNKQTVTNLEEQQLDKIKGGLDSIHASCFLSCAETCNVRTYPCWSCPVNCQ
jgi:natural product precursor